MKIKRYLVMFMVFNLNAFEVYPEVSAKIISLKTVESKFAKNDILVKLDDRQAKLQLKYLQTINKTYEQNLKDKELVFKEKKELFDRLVGSRRELKDSRLDFEKAQRELKGHQIKIAISKIELEKYLILAPFAGVVEKVNNKNATNINNGVALMKIKHQ